MLDELNHESEQDDIDGMKKEVDSRGKVLHIEKSGW